MFGDNVFFEIGGGALFARCCGLTAGLSADNAVCREYIGSDLANVVGGELPGVLLVSERSSVRSGILDRSGGGPDFCRR